MTLATRDHEWHPAVPASLPARPAAAQVPLARQLGECWNESQVFDDALEIHR